MGAGAATQAGVRQNAEELLPSRQLQGERFGPEFEVVLLAPELQHLPVRHRYHLRVAYEALVVVDIGTNTPLTYFKYQDIICWGSTKSLFQFKVFGTVFGHEKNNLVAVLFQTRHGAELESITLKSVKLLMKDMEAVAVSKQDFLVLKGLLLHMQQEQSMDPDERKASWLSAVRTFAANRQYTCDQGTELVRMAYDVPEMDSFNLLDLAMYLWDSTLNRDSFQLILNVLGDHDTRHNAIERICMHYPHDKSAQLLKANCHDVGGGLTGGAAIVSSSRAAHSSGELAPARVEGKPKGLAPWAKEAGSHTQSNHEGARSATGGVAEAYPTVHGYVLKDNKGGPSFSSSLVGARMHASPSSSSEKDVAGSSRTTT
uniref:IRS-type PTB domain-containing protein n=1 Tax=Rhizochromulina marina TaxID=1034831 RepID=A0A7S2S214_9STRA|mmetsp:Transcript_24009/g.70425  ORF Transcript_24009/g.70425 Transcript_24009/m.70425 type:complete len:372 (+) Transcript_24009:113-1228(+)